MQKSLPGKRLNTEHLDLLFNLVKIIHFLFDSFLTKQVYKKIV